MARYPSSSRIREGLERLSASRAKPTFSDYLACSRALHIASLETPPSTLIETGQNDRPFQTGLDDVALITPPSESGLTWQGDPFLFVFDSAKPFRTGRHRSNGTADTANRWRTKDHAPFVMSGSPRRLSASSTATAAGVASLFLKTDDSFELPRADDFAFWYYRYTDLDARFGPIAIDVSSLIGALLDDLGVPKDVFETIFEIKVPALSDGDFGTDLPDPNEFIAEAPPAAREGHGESDLGKDVAAIHKFVSERGYTVEPWQVAAFVTAVRTKPFVILAGISGTGKTKLPRLVAEATGATGPQYRLFPVRPDWTDSAELLGYRNLKDEFRPGVMLEAARSAEEEPDDQLFVMLDEMNIARVEYYLAEVLSLIEERERQADGSVKSKPLAPAGDPPWDQVALSSNLCLVGSVNMDETTHGFARKVLDRAFVLEFSDVDLAALGVIASDPKPPLSWDAKRWSQRFLSLAEYPDRADPDLLRAISVLTEVNEFLRPVQLQVGYRVRDEVALFVLNARDCIDAFVTAEDVEIDPLDLAIVMKVLPRIQGGSAGVRAALENLLAWASADHGSGDGAAFPMCAARLQLMLDRYNDSGFTSFWL